MKLLNIIIVFLIVIGIMAGRDAYAKDHPATETKKNVETDTLVPFLTAVQKGDVETIKQLLSEEDYQAYRVLLEKNPGYAEFLRRHYKDATFQIKEKGANYQVEVKFPDGQKEVHRLGVQGGE